MYFTKHTIFSCKLTYFIQYKYTRLPLLFKWQLKTVILINPLFLIIHLRDLCNIHRAQIKEEKHIKAKLSPDLNSPSLTPERSSFRGSKIKLSSTSRAGRCSISQRSANTLFTADDRAGPLALVGARAQLPPALPVNSRTLDRGGESSPSEGHTRE